MNGPLLLPENVLIFAWLGAECTTPVHVRCVLLLLLLSIGGAVGSFANVVIYRVPRGKSIVHPGSHCPQCQHPIRWYDNIPMISWLVLRGRCRDCGAPISIRYPLVEAAVAVLFGLLVLLF